MVLGAIFLVTMLLVAMPSHRPPVVTTVYADTSVGVEQGEQQSGKSADSSDDKVNERPAVRAMTPGGENSHKLHMTMTGMRAENPQDIERAKQIATQLRGAIEKYKDYRVALADGYRIFLPNIPQPEYHFTNYWNGFLESMTFNPERPTSLLYRKTATGYELRGAMYTMPRSATEDELNARVPLSVAMWHLHTNLCMPRLGQLRTADWTKFGLGGSIATQDACDAAGGRFHPSIFGWMVHVYPYEDSMDKMFPMHM
jgi:hypothetical protein